MNFAAVSHRPSQEFIYAPSRGELVIELFTAVKDMKSVTLLIWERYENSPDAVKRIPVTVSLRGEYKDCYRVRVKTQSIAAYIRYCFELHSEEEVYWFGRKGFDKSPPTLDGNFFEFLWPNPTDGFRAPAWSTEQVYYQIFPERFCNGDPNLSPKNVVPWGSVPTRENFMGGDLPGIISKLDYLEDIGVTCLYLTPIFEGTSNHKYDTVDYYKIDPQFGEDKDLQVLVKEAHERKIRIILDGVFNHCGYYFPLFQDVIEKGSASEYADWFFVENYPVRNDPANYDCVGHYRWMPKINLANSKARDYFVNVGLYWIRNFGIDGWRLDVADEVPTAFWEHFSSEIKVENPDVLLLGETWGDASRLLMGNRLDSAMNYLFKDAVTDWIAKEAITVTQFDYLVNEMLSLYPDEVNLRMYNLLDSHDTARFLSECKGDKQKLKLAVALQMTFPGCPAIFYGDEIGIIGENDPLCRQPMEWNSFGECMDVMQWYKTFIVLRKENGALKKGDFHSILCDDKKKVYAYIRSIKENAVMIVLNASSEKQEVSLEIERHNTIWKEVLEARAENSAINSLKWSEAEYCGNFVVRLEMHSVKIFKEKEKV